MNLFILKASNKMLLNRIRMPGNGDSTEQSYPVIVRNILKTMVGLRGYK